MELSIFLAKWLGLYFIIVLGIILAYYGFSLPLSATI